MSEPPDPMTALDGCPADGCDNTETPRAYAALDDGLMAAYCCSACGWEWVTEYRGDAVCSGDLSGARETIGATTKRALTPRTWRSAAEGSHQHNLDERP